MDHPIARVPRLAGATKAHVRTIRSLQRRLAPLAGSLNPPPVRWIHGADEGLDYCFECAEIAVAELRKANPADEFIVDGGWDARRESDGSTACTKCGRTLGYSLTNYGLL